MNDGELASVSASQTLQMHITLGRCISIGGRGKEVWMGSHYFALHIIVD